MLCPRDNNIECSQADAIQTYDRRSPEAFGELLRLSVWKGCRLPKRLSMKAKELNWLSYQYPKP
jgi:hypothetical protein